jgi:acetyltransferase
MRTAFPAATSAFDQGGVVMSGIPRYPMHLIDVLHAADGTRVVIRPLLPQDTELQRNFFRGLSAESRYGRFMAQVNHAPEALIERLAPVDYVRHLVLLAVVLEDGREVMIGEARYVLDARDATTGELAIAVADAWQSQGIGRALLVRLQRQAAASGVRRLVAETLSGNRRMINLARSASFSVTTSREDPRLVVLGKVLAAEKPAAA